MVGTALSQQEPGEKFGNGVKNIQSHKMPCTPKVLTVSPMIESEKISVEDQKEHWSGLGMLLYLVKHSRPDIANTTKELLKGNDGTNSATFKELLYVI